MDFCAATSLLTKRAVVEQIGFFEDLFIHFDDVEWCMRMNAAGWKVIATPKSRIWHASQDSKTTRWIRYYDVRNILRLYQKYKPSLLKKAVKHFRKLGRYFTLHGFKRTSRMIREGIRDFKRGVTGRRDHVQENTSSLSDLPRDFENRRKYFVFPDFGSLCRAAEKLPFGYLSGETVFLYKKVNRKKAYEIVGTPVKAVMPKKRKKVYKLAVYARQLISTRGKSKLIFIDGKFERTFIPPPFKRGIYLYPGHDTFIDTRKRKT